MHKADGDAHSCWAHVQYDGLEHVGSVHRLIRVCGSTGVKGYHSRICWGVNCGPKGCSDTKQCVAHPSCTVHPLTRCGVSCAQKADATCHEGIPAAAAVIGCDVEVLSHTLQQYTAAYSGAHQTLLVGVCFPMVSKTPSQHRTTLLVSPPWCITPWVGWQWTSGHGC